MLSWLLGSALDRRAAKADRLVTDLERKVARATALGTLLVAVSPIGPRLLVFPLVAARRSDVFGQVVEWQSPGFRRPAELVYLGLVLLTLALLVRAGTWRLAFPALMLVGASLYAQRNIVLAVVVLVAVAARCAPAWGSLRAGDRPGLGRPLAAMAGAVTALVVVGTLLTPVASLESYAGNPVAWLESQPWSGGRTATEVRTGNMFEVLDVGPASVFIDDRFDLMPDDVFDDYLTLVQGRLDWSVVLDEYDIDSVVWSRQAPLASLLQTSSAWRVSYQDNDWLVACRRVICSSR